MIKQLVFNKNVICASCLLVGGDAFKWLVVETGVHMHTRFCSEHRMLGEEICFIQDEDTRKVYMHIKTIADQGQLLLLLFFFCALMLQ